MSKHHIGHPDSTLTGFPVTQTQMKTVNLAEGVGAQVLTHCWLLGTTQKFLEEKARIGSLPECRVLEFMAASSPCAGRVLLSECPPPSLYLAWFPWPASGFLVVETLLDGQL